MVKIYLSPSNQMDNKYVVGSTTECLQMEELARLLMTRLVGYDCAVKIADRNTTISYNGRPAEAKKFGANIYLALHSNAGGSNGAEAYYHANMPNTKKLAETLVVVMAKICPIKSKRAQPVKDGMTAFNGAGYGEIRDPAACGVPSVLFEVDYHDNPSTAKWIIDSKSKIVDGIITALSTVYGIKKVGTTPPKPAQPTATIKKGDVVQITDNKYYDGTVAVPGWVKELYWIVDEVGKDRVVVNKDMGGKYAIMSAVKLTGVKKINPTPAPGKIPYLVKVTTDALNIRKTPSTSATITGVIRDRGIYTIVEQSGTWGKLKSGLGWISLDYTSEYKA